jgi:hypothetical protein
MPKLTGKNGFDHNGNPMRIHAYGNNLAMVCCNEPLLLVSLQGFKGSAKNKAVPCNKCNSQYYIDVPKLDTTDKLIIHRI